MFRIVRRSLSIVLVASLVLAGASADPTDLVLTSGGSYVQSIPYPAGTPASTIVTPGTGGLSSALGMTYGPDGYLYVASYGTDEVMRFTPQGERDCGFVWPSIPGFTGPTDVLFDPSDGTLLVSGFSCARVVRVNVSYGTWSDVITPGANGLTNPAGLAFHPLTGELLIADFWNDCVWSACFSSATTELCQFVASTSGGLYAPLQIAWSNNELYVVSNGSTQVLRYHGNGSPFVPDVVAPTGTEVPAIGTALYGLTFGPDGLLYVSDPGNSRILKYGVTPAVPGSSYIGVFATGVAALDFEFHSKPEASFPLRRGMIVATYCADLIGDPLYGPRPDPTKPVVIAVDAREDGPKGHNWLAPKFWNEHATNPADVWNAGNLGPVFGECLDRAGNLYVAATSAYGAFSPAIYPAGPGAVYKIDGATGAISVWLGTTAVSSIPLASTPGITALPNTGPGLGDIDYDAASDVFYVTNLEDGRIYVVKDTPSGGVVQSAFDPFDDDETTDGTPGMPVRGERVYAVHWITGRLVCWSAWLCDRGNPGPAWPSNWPPLPPGDQPNNAIFFSLSSVNSSTGKVELNGTTLRKVMPYFGTDYSNPVTDITDEEDGADPFAVPRLLLTAERTFNGDYGDINTGMSAHAARVLEFTLASGMPPSGTPYYVGDETMIQAGTANCAGGVCYDADSNVWATGDALDLSYSAGVICHATYGLERIPSFGNAISPETSVCNLIDLDEFTAYYNKSQPGDVEVVHFPYPMATSFPVGCTGVVGTACPCGNFGGAGSGCASSVDPNGGQLTGSGLASIAADTVVLHADGMPNSSALFFQGTTLLNGGNGVAFGDGVRCAGGSIIRLGTQVNVAGSSTYPSAGDASVSVRGLCAPGDVRHYQVWYRNASAFCTPATFNLTNTTSCTWTP